MLNNQITRLLNYVLIVFLSIVLLGCQSSGSDGTDPVGDQDQLDKSGKSGKVAIVLTDAPNHDFSEVNLTITRISLLSNEMDEDKDDSGKNSVTIFEGEETVNLLALENYSHLFALSSEVPVGTYQKIRLTLKKENGIELVKKDETGEVTEVHYPKLTGNAKLDLNSRQPFEVIAGETLFIQLDIDAKKSIKITETGNGKYKFRPVVFIDVITPEFSGKLVRHTGFIRNLDVDNSRFNLCDTDGVEDSSLITDLCLLIHISESSLFNIDGDLIDVSELENDLFVTTIGYIQSHTAEKDDIIEFGQLLAQVIHVGEASEFSVRSGEVTSEIDETDSSFSLSVDESTLLNVILQSGTKIFSRNGELADSDDITIGAQLEAYGVFDADDTSLLFKSTLIIIEPEGDAEPEKISGEILELFPDTLSFILSGDTGDQTVMVSEETLVLTVDTTGEEAHTNAVMFADLAAGARIEVYGFESDTGGFLANLIVAFVE